MALLRALLRTTRMARTFSHPADGLPADDEVLLDAPDPRLAPALVSAGHGDHGPAAELLAATRMAGEWEDRDRYVTRLAAFARSRDEWFRRWCATVPDDPDALLVKAELAVARGWESPARAELLRDVGPLVAAAAEGDPRDPVPWRVALDHARGVDADHIAFERLWEEAVRRSRHHYGCHAAALAYLSAVWHGSHGECFDFAETAAHDTPPGSLMQALPLRAAFAYLTDGGGATVSRARLDAAADRSIALSSRYAPADPRLAEVRNLLAYVLVTLERRPDALTQLHLIGPYATSFPWDRFSDDPLGRFLDLRRGVSREPAALRAVPSAAPVLPRSERAGHAPVRDH
ncbi:hypothetical protein [Streptomyces gibsoniae]|uniref:DUF4034 domain-containing protein n=1 Tax=Streptomyces gibsoniae TaxID=3075529 RepID=A0ABU2TLA1_9ACTN|nr:hypothetical protein [Streptomyces sp. DSM 41699]MDT0461698.1 hypothetical protein [Streptomyces sp. DSM 41699]